MKLTTVTFTGVDDSISPDQIFKISQEYPWVEWGIYLRGHWYHPGNKFPSVQWCNKLSDLKRKYKKTQIALHFSDMLADNFLGGSQYQLSQFKDIVSASSRIQVNTSGRDDVRYGGSKGLYKNFEYFGKQLIFQFDNRHLYPIALGLAHSLITGVLFDTSFGNGKLPDRWPDPFYRIYCGYAGGFNASNVVEQVNIISAKPFNKVFWIDIESGIRGIDGGFDLNKCIEILELVKPYVEIVKTKKKRK